MSPQDQLDWARICAQATEWVNKNQEIFLEASSLTDDQKSSLAPLLELTPVQRVFAVRERMEKWTYIKDEARGQIPISASQTFVSMQGDCKDYSTLVAAMLLAVELKPSLVKVVTNQSPSHMYCTERVTGISLDNDPTPEIYWVQHAVRLDLLSRRTPASRASLREQRKETSRRLIDRLIKKQPREPHHDHARCPV
jgi:hypothetical protein